MTDRYSSRSRRLGLLLAVAAGLGLVAAVSNYRYWQQRAALRAEAARAAQVQSEFASHLADLEKRLRERPEDARTRFRLAELHFRTGNSARALAELDVLQQQQPQEPEVFLRKAMVYKTAGQLPEAEAAARRAHELAPDREGVREWLAEICLDRGRAREALGLFDRCLKEKPDAYVALVGKARALEELFRYQHPIAIPDMVAPVEKAVELNPRNPLGLLILARMNFVYLKRPDEAERLALRAVEQDTQNAGPYILLSEIALSRPPTPENLQRAGEYIYEAGRRNLRDSRPPYQLGRLYLQQNEVKKAIAALERSVALGPLPEAVSQLATAYRRSGNTERATYYAELYQTYTDRMERRDMLLRLLAQEPREIRHYYALAELYLEASELDMAENWVVAARRLRQADPLGSRLMERIQEMRKSGSRVPVLRLS